jgi:adenomatosis polyposis coli protein
MATLMKLSFDEEHRHTMTGLGGLQAIAELLEVDHRVHGLDPSPSSNASLSNPAQSFTSSSSSSESHQHQQQACVTLRRYAGMALTNLTFGDGGNKATLCSYRGFMVALVSQLQSCSEDLRQVCSKTSDY